MRPYYQHGAKNSNVIDTFVSSKSAKSRRICLTNTAVFGYASIVSLIHLMNLSFVEKIKAKVTR